MDQHDTQLPTRSRDPAAVSAAAQPATMTGGGNGSAPAPVPLVGRVAGSGEATTSRFHVVLAENAVAELDELVVTVQQLPGTGETLTHYGIVVEAGGLIEGAELSSDTERITGSQTMPGQVVRTAHVQVLRTVPERWLPPAPGALVYQAAGADREMALFLDQMEQPLKAGLDQARRPVFADFSFLNGEKGGHVSISGVSGVATKTSYALFLLWMLLETDDGRALLGAHAAATRALVFNVKGEDSLHLDRPNAKFAARPDAPGDWLALGETPGPFRRVRVYAPQAAGTRRGQLVPDVTSRAAADVVTYGWPPDQFIRQGLLRFCFAEEEDARTQVGFVEQRVRLQLARWAYPLQNEPGAVVLCPPPAGTSMVMSRVVEQARPVRPAGDGFPVRTFTDLAEFLAQKVGDEDLDWIAGAASGTCQAFLRRLYAAMPRLGHLITTGVHPVLLEEAVTVVDIHALHDSAQRFVVGALLSRVFEEKQGSGREPLRFVILDELNKYAPRTGRSPIKDVLVDIAARGRSLGVLLIGAQQSAGDVDGNIIRNAAVKVVGRLDAGETAEYRFLSPEVRERAARFLPGTMVLDQPLIPAPLPLRFPFPGFATNVAEGALSGDEIRAAASGLFDQL
jgi:DNA helicase HerA-like ATPase